MPITHSALSYSQRLQQAENHRHTGLRKIADGELFSLTSMMGPINDGPQWPSDAAWLAMSINGNAVIVSDGLSDPWVEPDRPATGLGLEVFVESPDVLLSAQAPLQIADSWMFPMIAEISHTLASYPNLVTKLINNEPLALRFNIEHIKDGRGLVGALLHTPPEFTSGINTLLGEVKLVAATLLTGDELHWLAGKKLAGRRELLNKLYREGVGRQSITTRPSVI